MHIYFNGMTGTGNFDPKNIDLTAYQHPIFNLEITEKEGQFPVATVLLQNPYQGLLSHDFYSHAAITVSHNDTLQLLFVGQIISVPDKISGEMMQITIMAKPYGHESQIKMLQQNLKQAVGWDPLFVKKGCENSLSELLDGRYELLYWSRFNEPVRLSNIFWGSQRYVLGQRFFRGDLKFQSVGHPLSSICVSLSMEWIQKYRGYTDVSYQLRSRFPQGLINTFTGKNLESKWWKRDESIGRSGYWIEHSQLKEISPLFTGILQLYPATSSELALSPHDPLNKTGKPGHVKIKRSWYKASVTLGWYYKQKRVETVTFVLNNRLQIAAHNSVHTRRLDIQLQSFVPDTPIEREWKAGLLYAVHDRIINNGVIYQALKQHLSSNHWVNDNHHWQPIDQSNTDPVSTSAAQQASFFTTDRGLQSINHALTIAQAHLAASTRVVELTFDAPFDAVMHLTCDHSVLIHDPRLPGGQAWGKVKAVRLAIEGQSGKMWGEITLVSSIGEGHIDGCGEAIDIDSQTIGQADSDHDQLYFHQDYGDSSYTKHDRSTSPPPVVPVSDYYHRDQLTMPTQGILYPDQLTDYDIVTSVKIVNGPAQQHTALIRQQYPARHNTTRVLSENHTEIVLRLRDLQPVPVLRHDINLSILKDWTAPQQINLRALKTND